MTDDTARQAVRHGRKMRGSVIKSQVVYTSATLSSYSQCCSSSQFYSFGGFRRFGVMFWPKSKLCQCTLAIAETRPKPYVRSVSAS